MSKAEINKKISDLPGKISEWIAADPRRAIEVGSLAALGIGQAYASYRGDTMYYPALFASAINDMVPNFGINWRPGSEAQDLIEDAKERAGKRLDSARQAFMGIAKTGASLGRYVPGVHQEGIRFYDHVRNAKKSKAPPSSPPDQDPKGWDMLASGSEQFVMSKVPEYQAAGWTLQTTHNDYPDGRSTWYLWGFLEPKTEEQIVIQAMLANRENDAAAAVPIPLLIGEIGAIVYLAVKLPEICHAVAGTLKMAAEAVPL